MRFSFDFDERFFHFCSFLVRRIFLAPNKFDICVRKGKTFDSQTFAETQIVGKIASALLFCILFTSLNLRFSHCATRATIAFAANDFFVATKTTITTTNDNCNQQLAKLLLSSKNRTKPRLGLPLRRKVQDRQEECCVKLDVGRLERSKDWNSANNAKRGDEKKRRSPLENKFSLNFIHSTQTNSTHSKWTTIKEYRRITL